MNLVIAVFVIAFGYYYFALFYKAGAREIRRLGNYMTEYHEIED